MLENQNIVGWGLPNNHSFFVKKENSLCNEFKIWNFRTNNNIHDFCLLLKFYILVFSIHNVKWWCMMLLAMWSFWVFLVYGGMQYLRIGVECCCLSDQFCNKDIFFNLYWLGCFNCCFSFSENPLSVENGWLMMWECHKSVAF